MALVDINTIKNWFRTGMIPTQSQFWSVFDSYRHKNDAVPVSEVEGINELLATRASKQVLDNHMAQKGAPNGYAPLDEFTKLAAQYLNIVNDLVTGGSTALLSAEQGLVLQTQISAINTLLTSDNVNLDTVQELVDAIETVQLSLSSILVNDLTTGGTTKALTAEMGKQLDLLKENLSNKSTAIIEGTNETSNIKYPTIKAVYDWCFGKFQPKLIAGSNITIIGNTISSSGGGEGASNLNDLLDVNASLPQTNDGLIFNGTEWVSAPNPTVVGVFSGGQFVLPEQVGNIYNKNNWSNTTDFSVTGTASVALNGDKLNLTSSGSGSFGDMLKINNKISLLERWNIKAKVKITSNTATSHGIGFGIRSVNTFGAPSLIGRFTTYPSGNVLILNNGESNGEVRNVSTFNMAINDIIEFELDFSDGYVILSLKKGTAIITTTYQYNLYNLAPFLPNTGQFVATILGPSAEIQQLNISSSIFKRADLMIIGDSKLQGYNTSGFQRTVCSLLRQRYPVVINSAGGYDRTAEGVARLTELKALIPKNVVLHLGSNDKRTGVTFSDWSTRFMQIKTEMESVGSVVYAMKMFNENTLLFTDYNDFITANFPANRIIDVGNLVNLIDGIHPNDQHQVQIMEAIYAKVGYVKSIYVESGVTNSSTTSLSKSYLDANYPNVSVGFKVYANSIVTGALEYEKTNLGWTQKNVNVLI